MVSTEVGYKRLSSLAALYDLTLGPAVLIFLSPLIVAVAGMPVPTRGLLVLPQMGLLLVRVFGIGFQMVSRNLNGYVEIVILGTIGKIIVFLLFLYHFISSGLHVALSLIGVRDLIFALFLTGFIGFIRNDTMVETA